MSKLIFQEKKKPKEWPPHFPHKLWRNKMKQKTAQFQMKHSTKKSMGDTHWWGEKSATMKWSQLHSLDSDYNHWPFPSVNTVPHSGWIKSFLNQQRELALNRQGPQQQIWITYSNPPGTRVNTRYITSAKGTSPQNRALTIRNQFVSLLYAVHRLLRALQPSG